MRQFKYATVECGCTKWIWSMNEKNRVIFTDACTPIAHTNAVTRWSHGEDTGEVTVICVNNFKTLQEAEVYCRERRLLVL